MWFGCRAPGFPGQRRSRVDANRLDAGLSGEQLALKMAGFSRVVEGSARRRATRPTRRTTDENSGLRCCHRSLSWRSPRRRLCCLCELVDEAANLEGIGDTNVQSPVAQSVSVLKDQ